MIEESDPEAHKKDEGAEIKLKAQKSKQKIPQIYWENIGIQIQETLRTLKRRDQRRISL